MIIITIIVNNISPNNSTMVFACLDRNGRRSTSLATFPVAPSPSCWATSSTLGRLAVWATRRVERMSPHNPMASPPLAFTSLCSPSNYQRCWLVLRSTNLPTPWMRLKCNMRRTVQRNMRGRSRWHATSSWGFVSNFDAMFFSPCILYERVATIL